VKSGDILGPYQVVDKLGEGGMGEVYRARDTRLNRDVAIKFLPELFAGDAERLARFTREAQTLAALNHPNIAQIYGLEAQAGAGGAASALVMELVEGKDLSRAIARGALPVADVLHFARQIADALAAAHEQGIVHRDLKPANIKVRADGTVKVLDFGLARALEPVRAEEASESSTVTSAGLTRAGMVLGTAAYMSPEQAGGHTVDRRADIWAFGCVLYEMLTGRRAFAGKDLSETLAYVVTREPDWAALPRDTPPAVRRLLRRSLVKDRRHRLADIADARIEIDEVDAEQAATGSPGSFPRRERLLWIATVSALAVLAAVAVAWSRRSPSPATEIRVDIVTPASSDPTAVAISPDGKKITFVATNDGRSQLWLRSLDSTSAQPLPGTDDARLPFWSHDSRSIGFGADARLKRIDLDGGRVRSLANAPVFLGGTWNAAGDIVFVPFANGAVFRVSADGGEPAAVTKTQPSQSHHSPRFLPDGRHFIFNAVGAADQRGIHVGELGKDGARYLLDADTGGVCVGDLILFTRRNTAFAQRIDPVKLEKIGDPVPFAQDVAVAPFGNGQFAGLTGSADGTIVYRTGQAARAPIQFAWFDRQGRELERVGDPLPMILNGALSPDQKHLAAFSGGDIWMIDLLRTRAFTRFTFDPSVEFAAVWSPDSRRVVISSNRAGAYDLYEKPATGAGTETPLLSTPQNKDATDWSSDGSYLLYRSFDPRRGYDILAMRLADRTTFPVVQTDADERNGQFSPDAKWVAYQSNESDRFEIWVQPFPLPGQTRAGKWQVSTKGGTQVRWNPNGGELFYLSPDARLMSVAVTVAPDGQAIQTGTPQPLLALPGIDFGRQGTVLPPYSVAANGQRFLFTTAGIQANSSPLTIILNWRQP
jgi:eukaryotic-like serine/threonine-protein kinase